MASEGKIVHRQKCFSADKRKQYVHTSTHTNTEVHSVKGGKGGEHSNDLIPFIKKGKLSASPLEAPKELQYFLKE